MKIDSNTLNFLSRGAEHTNGPRNAERGGDVFGTLFESRARPVERSSRGDATSAAATSSAKPQQTGRRESSDDAIESVKAGEAEAADRNVDESESKRPESDDTTTETRDQPEVGQADVKSKSESSTTNGGAKASDDQANKNGEGAAKQPGKPVVAELSNQRPVTNPNAEPRTEADQAAKVLDQLRQPAAPATDAELNPSKTESSADATIAKSAAMSTEVPAAQASGASDAKSNAPGGTSPAPNIAQASATDAAALPTNTTPDANAQAKDHDNEGGHQSKSNAFVNSAMAEKANGQATPDENESAIKPDAKPAASEPTVRMPTAGVHVAVDDGGPASRPLGQAGTLSTASTGAGPQTPLPEADATRVTDRVVKSLHTMAANRGGTVTLRLTPAELGTLRIQVTMSGGSVQATFEASTAAVGRVLEQNASSLRHALEGQGLNVERINVQVNSSGSSNASAQQNAGDSPTDGRSRGMTDQGGRNADGGSGQPNDQSPRRSFNEMLDLVA